MCFGISAKWWRDEHFEHHAFTNTLVQGVGSSDPQMKEVLWAQDPKLMEQPPYNFWLFRNVLVHIQHWIYLPVVVLIGRIGITIDSLREERRADVWLTIMLHFAWVAAVLSLFPSPSPSHPFPSRPVLACPGLACPVCLSVRSQGHLHASRTLHCSLTHWTTGRTYSD